MQEDSAQYSHEMKGQIVHDLNSLSEYQFQVQVWSPNENAKQDQAVTCHMQYVFLYRHHSQFFARHATHSRTSYHTDQMKWKEE